jgi:hypothetical protein
VWHSHRDLEVDMSAWGRRRVGYNGTAGGHAEPGSVASKRAARVATFAVTGVLVLATGVFAAVVTSSQAASPPTQQRTSEEAATPSTYAVAWRGTRSLAVAPADPVPGEGVHLRGRFAEGVSPEATVRVQVKRAGAPWRTVRRGADLSRLGKWRTHVKAPARLGRMVARAQLLDGDRHVVSSSRRAGVKVTELRVALDAPDHISADQPSDVVVAVSPPRPGTRVTVLGAFVPNPDATGAGQRDVFDPFVFATALQPKPQPTAPSFSVITFHLPPLNTLSGWDQVSDPETFFDQFVLDLQIKLGAYGSPPVVHPDAPTVTVIPPAPPTPSTPTYTQPTDEEPF